MQTPRPLSRLAIALSAAVLTITTAHAAGALDPTFGTGGRVQTDFQGGVDRASGSAVQADGKLLVGGLSNGAMAIARYVPNGALDASFGVGGRVTLPGVPAGGGRIALQADGKIVIGYQDGSALAALRLRGDGSLDTGFGVGGRVSVPVFRNGVRFTATLGKTLALASGKVWLLGQSNLDVFNVTDDSIEMAPGGESRATLVVLNADGSPDTAVGPNGTVIVGRAGPTGLPTDVPLSGVNDAVEQPDGVVVVGGAGVFGQGLERGLVIARLNPASGDHDSRFGFGGRTRLSAAPNDSYASVAALADGSLVAAASTRATNVPSLRVDRFYANGMADPNFLVARVDIPRSPFLAAAGDKVWVVADLNFSPAGDIAVRRLTSTGALDGSFGISGVLKVDFGGNDITTSVAVQADGKLLLNALPIGLPDDFFVARIDAAAPAVPPPPPPPPLPPAPAAPTGLAASADRNGFVTLTWADRSNNETSFLVERSTSAGFNPVFRFVTAANTTSFVDTGLSPRTTYFYRVTAVNAGGSSAPTTTSVVTGRR